MTDSSSRGPARTPEELPRLFHARANAGDVDGLVALYETDAILAVGVPVATGHAEIRKFYADLLARRSSFAETELLPVLINGDLAMTISRLPNGSTSVEIARRQSDGGWLWVIDQLKVKPAAG
jgi:ketosteroid isomerase-like protein